MYRIQTLNEISDIIYNRLDKNYAVSKDEAAPDAVLVRSAAMHDTEFGPELLCQ